MQQLLCRILEAVSHPAVLLSQCEECFVRLQWYRERMQELRRRILEEREGTADKVVPSAFVTFKCGHHALLPQLALVLLHVRGLTTWQSARLFCADSSVLIMAVPPLTSPEHAGLFWRPCCDGG